MTDKEKALQTALANIEKQFGKGLARDEVIAKARAYAYKQIDRQREGFKRLGVLGDWDNPYVTMHYETEAEEIRVLALAVGPVNQFFTRFILSSMPTSNPHTCCTMFARSAYSPGVSIFWMRSCAPTAP